MWWQDSEKAWAMQMLADLPRPPSGKQGWPWTEASESLPEKVADGHSWPRITVVTPSYNQGRFIEETIRSVLLQGYPNLEYIIVDGGSTDETVAIIRKYEPWLAYWVSEKDRGQTHAINKGWQRATGDIIAWLNSDDVYPANALHHAGRAFQEQLQSVMVYGDSVAIDEHSQYLRRKRLPNFSKETVLFKRNMSQPAVFLRRRVLDEIGYPDEKLYYVMDREFFLRVWHHYHRACCTYVPRVLAYTRIWSDTKTATGVSKITDEWRTVLKAFFSRHRADFAGSDTALRAYRGSYVMQARLQMQAGQRWQAQMSILQAARLRPGWQQRLKLLARLTSRNWLGKSRTVKMGRIWGRLQKEL